MCQQNLTFLFQGDGRKDLSKVKKKEADIEQKVVCFQCKNIGHTARRCSSNLFNEQKEQKSRTC